MRETEKITKQPTVTVRITPGEATHAMKNMWWRFWQRMIAAAKREVDSDR